MTVMLRHEQEARIVLAAATAAELMTANPISVEADLSVMKATAFMVDKGFSAAPVIDETGRAVGVLSQTDLLVHNRENQARTTLRPDFYDRGDLRAEATEIRGVAPGTIDEDSTCVRDVMTPVVLAVSPETSAASVIEELLGQRVHRLFVVDKAGVLIGVVSTVDILRHLRSERLDSGAATGSKREVV